MWDFGLWDLVRNTELFLLSLVLLFQKGQDQNRWSPLQDINHQVRGLRSSPDYWAFRPLGVHPMTGSDSPRLTPRMNPRICLICGISSNPTHCVFCGISIRGQIRLWELGWKREFGVNPTTSEKATCGISVCGIWSEIHGYFFLQQLECITRLT